MNMREDDAHCTAVQHPLNETVTTLVWYSDKRCDSVLQASDAKVAGLLDGECRVFEVDEQAVIACVTSKLDDLGVGDKPHS